MSSISESSPEPMHLMLSKNISEQLVKPFNLAIAKEAH